MATTKKKTPQWTFNGRTIDDIDKTPEGSISFIYRITLEDGRYYIGRKMMMKPKYTSGKMKGQSKGEYSWKTYKGSSKELLEVLKSGIEYKKEIIQFCFSKAETTYEETKAILCTGALTDPKAFNFWVKATIYSRHLEENS